MAERTFKPRLVSDNHGAAQAPHPKAPHPEAPHPKAPHPQAPHPKPPPVRDIDSRPTDAQKKWLCAGLDQAGGKLPLFDADGQRVPERTVKSCIAKGWAQPWFDNPLKPGWLVCKLTHLGRVVAEE